MPAAANLDVFRNSPESMAAAYRAAAATARVDFHYTAAERERRARWYEQQAELMEQRAQQDRSAA